MPLSILLPQFLLPKTAVGLGRFVTNVDEPNQDFHAPAADPSPYIAEPKVQNCYKGIDSKRQRRNMTSELTRFLSASLSKRGGTNIRVISGQVKTYYLDNAGDWFREAVHAEETRKWIEKTIDEGVDMYLVTGYHTLLDACVAVQSQNSSDASGGLVFPVPIAPAVTAGILLPIGGLSDSGVTAGSARARGLQMSFEAEGEQICAVQYRKICYSWYRSKDVEKMNLAKKVTWKRYDRPRLRQGDVPDMIEVDLEDTESLGTGRDVHVTEAGEIFVASFGVDSQPA